MKAVKLLLAFVLILGVVVGALYLTGAMGSDDGSNVKDPETFDKMSKLLEEKWNSVDWNSDLYDEFLMDIEQNENKLGTEYKNTLIDRLNEKAIPKLHAAMMGEFAKSDCDNQTIKDYKIYLDKFLETGRVENTKLSEMTGTYNVYQEALTFCSKSITFNPGNGTTWVPLNTQKQNYITKRNNIKAKPYYKNIENIDKIAKFMNNLEANMNTASRGFKDAVAKKIHDKYKSGVGDFLDVKAKFDKEFGTHSSLQGLVDLYI